MTTKEFFQNYSVALLSYSPETIASFYVVPMTVYSDEGVQQVTKMEEVTGFWKEGIKPYEKSNIIKSVPEILTEDQLSETIAVCKVNWKNYDESDNEVAQETNFYILRRVKDELKICGLVIMTP